MPKPTKFETSNSQHSFTLELRHGDRQLTLLEERSQRFTAAACEIAAERVSSVACTLEMASLSILLGDMGDHGSSWGDPFLQLASIGDGLAVPAGSPPEAVSPKAV